MMAVLASLTLLFADPPDTLLQRARALISDNAAHITRYSCSQTIRRESRRHRDPLWEKVDCQGILDARAAGKGPALQPASWDRIRLDVLLSQGTETHSWPHGGPIEPGVFELMTARGSFGSGDFAAFPISILAEGAATIRFQRDQGGTFVYAYRVPRERSRYALDSGPKREVTGYAGELWIDAATARLRKLTVITDILPRSTGFCQATTTTGFNPESEVLMPSSTRLDGITALGNEDSNAIEYTGCRAFTAESRIQFDPPSPNVLAADTAAAIPPGRTVRLRLTATIDSARAAGGDPVDFTIRTPIRNGRATLVPAGATIHGRIVHLERESMPQRGYWLLLVLDEVEFGGRAQPVRLRPPTAALPELGRIPGIPLGTEGPPQVGRFWFANMDPLVLKPGWESVWETW